MIAGWAAIVVAVGYLLSLFAVAHWGDGRGQALVRGRWRADVYALSFGVYCTSWTFFGSVGLATRAGLDFLTIYIGPILVIGLGHRLVARVVLIAKAQNSTSVADFVAARYGKSEVVAVLVTLIAVVGAIPYLALQLKAVSSSLEVLFEARGAPAPELPVFGGLAFVVAIVMAGFAVAFGTRSSAATEHQTGLVLAITLESVVKLAAFLAVGGFVALWMTSPEDGAGSRVLELTDRLPDLVGRTSGPVGLLALTLLSASVTLILPRQFFVGVVENRNVADVRRTAWLFPAYLVAINVFVVPIALAGLAILPEAGTNRDMTVLLLPLAGGSGAVALAAFVGGLSAATAMVIAETVAVSIMISSHIVIPLLLRFGPRRGPPDGSDRPRVSVLHVRRLAIVGVTLLGFAYAEIAEDDALASIGLLSFAALAQIAPAFVGGLFWKRATALGAAAGLAGGTIVWAYTLLLPAVLSADHPLRTAGPAGLDWLRPTALFGAQFDQLPHGTFWSLGVNVAAFVVFSLLRQPRALERLQAGAFVGGTGAAAPALGTIRTGIRVDDLRAAVARYLGAERTERSFASFARSRGSVLDGAAEADNHLLGYAEHALASAIGAASSRLALSLLLKRRHLSGRDALRLLDDASSAIQQNRDLLQHALDHAQQGINVLDRDLKLLCWNHAFVELYDFPPDLVRIGVGLDEITRVNAERGVYGPGDVDELVAKRLHDLVGGTGPVRLRLATSGRVISTRSNPLPGGGLFITFTDVTELADEQAARERETEDLERRVRQRTEELTRLNEELTRAKREADAANASKTQFLAAASHDILQPLNAARLYTTALVENRRGEEAAALAENIDASLEAVEDILTTLLDISRLDAGALRPQLATVRLDDVFRQLAREFAPAAAERGLRLRFAPTTLCVRSDRSLLRRLLQNLVSNAVKYTLTGTVLIGVRRAGALVRVEVHDTGLGIAPALQQVVFREFRRLPEGARTAGGLGLGLSIVERIARTLAVPIRLRSEVGRGSVFSVALARAEPVAAGARRSPGAVPVASQRLDGLAVLAIDNEPAVLDGLRRLVEGWGCTVRVARSLSEALAVSVDRPPPEILVADYQLDGEDGLTTIAVLREEFGHDLPAVLATADRSEDLREAAGRAGVAVLHKPIRPASLRAILTRARAVALAAE